MADAQLGPYRLVGRLGRGGMGEVHRAYDTRRHREVALKLLRDDIGAEEQFRERFRREALLAAKLQDPHVVPIHDFGEIDGRMFIDMRLVHGRDAAELLAAEGPMPPQRAVALIAQVADALDEAHAEGVVHRDVKPSNILVTPSDFVYLVDFGIARAVLEASSAGLTATGTAVGTVQYMAPEQFDGATVDGRVDVYALACVFHELLTGEPPFRGSTLPAIMQAHLHTPPPRPSVLRPGIPAGLDDVIARGMAKRPQDRTPTAGALAVAAREALRPGTDPTARALQAPQVRHPPAPAPMPTPMPYPPIPYPSRPGPPPPPPGLGRRALLVAGAVVVAAGLAVGSALVASAVINGGGTPVTSSPPTTQAAPPTTPMVTSTTSAPDEPPGSTFGLPGAQGELAMLVDPAAVSTCRDVNADPEAIELVAQIECLSVEGEPRSTIVLLRFADSDALNTQINREARVASTGPADYDQNCRDGALVDTWNRQNGRPADGRVVCRQSGNPASPLRIAWTFRDQLVAAYAEGTSPEFYNWWQRNASLLR